jgi:hypothetical protein
MTTQKHWREELKRQCEIRNLPYSEVEYLCAEIESEAYRRCLEAVPEEKVPSKHDGCTLDDCFCYNHREIMNEADYPNGARDFNECRSQVLQSIQSLLEESKKG